MILLAAIILLPCIAAVGIGWAVGEEIARGVAKRTQTDLDREVNGALHVR